MENLKAISSWSGGKDSCLAYFKARKNGVDISCLLNFISRQSRRGCFHGLEAGLLKFQADLIGIPLVQKEVSPDMALYESEFKAAVTELKHSRKINSMVFGDIYLLEHQSWVERVCNELGIRPVEPLWNNDPEKIVDEFISAGFKAIIVSCKADVMGKEFIGRSIDKTLVKDLKKIGVCPCGEKGEYHTLVVDGPIFKKRIQVSESEVIKKESFWTHWFLDIKKFTAAALFAFFYLFSTGNSFAEDIELEKIVITPSRIEESYGDTARSVDVVTGKEIEYSGAQDVAEALTDLTSVDISDYGGAGELKNIRMRGSTAAQVLVAVDGRPMNNPRSGEIDLSTLPLDNIEQIEVVHGPASSLYGSQAMGGTVNIITKQPPVKGFETSISSSFGTFRTYTDRLLHGGKVGNFGYLFSGGYLSSQGFRDNSKVNSKDANAKFEYSLNDNNTLKFGSGFYRGKIGLPGFINSPDTDDKQLAVTNYFDLGWNFKPDSITGLSARIYQNYDRLEFMENSAGAFWETADEKNIHSTISRGLEVQFSRRLFDFYQLICGLNYIGNYNDSTSSAKHNYNVRAAYLENQWDVTSKFKLNFSARIDDYSNFGAQFSPGLSAAYKITEDIKLHGLIARSFRAPTFNDLYWSSPGMLSNPDLRPEKGLTGEIGIEGKLAEKLLTGITYYRSKYSELIQWAPLTDDPWGDWSVKNIGSAVIDGIELSNQISITDDLQLGLNYSFMIARDEKTHKYLIYQPKNKADVSLRYKNPAGFIFGLKGQFTDARFTNANNTTTVKRFFVFGLSLSKKFSNGLTCFGSVDNLFARQYQVQSGYPMPGFSATGGLKLEF